MRSLGHLYLPCAKPVQWCDGLMGQTRASGVSGQSRRLVEVTWVVAQACHMAGVSVTEGKLYKGENRMVYIGTE